MEPDRETVVAAFFLILEMQSELNRSQNLDSGKVSRSLTAPPWMARVQPTLATAIRAAVGPVRAQK
jgi:hypothetical protein